MATTIGISTGPLTGSRTFSNDAEAQRILLLFADHIGATGTNQQKLTAIVDWLVARIQAGASEQQFSVQRDALRESIGEGNRLT